MYRKVRAVNPGRGCGTRQRALQISFNLDDSLCALGSALLTLNSRLSTPYKGCVPGLCTQVLWKCKLTENARRGR